MNTTYPIAALGELIGDPARSAILVALLDGGARTAGELALTANVSAQSASGHLSKLLDGGLLTVSSTGRHRYYALAGPDIAHALEALYLARTCYDHHAGRMAVALAGSLQKSGVLRITGARDFELGKRGSRWFANLGIDVDQLRRSRRCFARQCIDWTERRPHLAGVLGAALCSRLIALGWIARRQHTRALRITDRGAREFRTVFGLSVSADGL